VERTRFWSYAVAAVVLVLSLAASVGDVGANAVFLLPVLSVPLSIAVATLVRSWAAAALAIGACVSAIWSPDVPSLWLAMAVLVFGSLAEDRQARPWMGWAGGVSGASFSIYVYDSGNFAPFLATALGGAAGLLLRSRLRTTELVGEADELRGQAAWLEQRTAVARELHDVVGHHVTAMVVQAEAGQVAEPQEALRTIGELGRTALAELDSLVVHLRDPGAPLTVSAPPRLLDIDELLGEPLRAAGVTVDVRLGDDLGLDELDVLTVYRIAQEALTNVVRHARARHVWVELTRSGDLVRLRVSDDGAGPPAERTRGSGLLGIEERVSGRGGSVELIGRPGGGAILDVSLPVSQP